MDPPQALGCKKNGWIWGPASRVQVGRSRSNRIKRGFERPTFRSTAATIVTQPN